MLGTAAAVAAVIVSIFLLDREEAPGPAELYVQEYTDGIRGILDNIRDMEMESDVCRQKQLDGLDMDDKMLVLKTYYDRQTECVASLYRDCIRAYSHDMMRNY